MKKIIFIGGLNHPRTIKRITTFYNYGFDVVVYGYDRQRFQNVNSIPDKIEAHKLGTAIDGGGYIRKLFSLMASIRKICKKYNDEEVSYYSFGFISSLLLYFLTSKPYIYEISDIIYANFNNKYIRSILRYIDRKVIRGSHLTLMTSKGFEEWLFPKNPPQNIIIQPNKMNSYFHSIERKAKHISDNINFAFIGWLRYPNTIFRFAKIIGESYPKHSFHFYGDSDYRDQAAALANQYNNIYFHGKFKNPEDLEKIYNSIDVVIACYDTSTINERIAEPNKLYEAMFFCKPIVVSPNIFLAKQVEHYGCGLTLDASSDENITSFLDCLEVNKLNKIVKTCLSVDKEELIDNPNILVQRVTKEE